MNDFSDTLGQPNLLPGDGLLTYFPDFIGIEARDRYFNSLMSDVPWQPDKIKMFGKTIVTKRETAWFGDHRFSYSYSGFTRTALDWNADLLQIKEMINRKFRTSLNSCLLNLYHDGSESMGWHSDDEKPLGPDPIIAAVSFGAARPIRFRHKQGRSQPISILLEPGSLLLMGEGTQANWQHSIPASKKILEPRISLTFRTILPSL